MRTPILSLLILPLLSYSADAGPIRKRLGSARPAVEIPNKAATEPAGPSLEKVWGITGYRPGPCPRCPPVPVYGWIEKQSAEQPSEKAIDDAASRLAKGGLSREEEKKLAAVIDAPAVKKARAGHWAPGTCQMLCDIPSHGTHWVWDDPVDDGTPEPAWGSWGGNSSGGGGRIFGRRRR